MIEVHQLGKRYGSLTALDGVSLTVAPGEIFGVLGPNGAGKTTLLRILSGRARPSSGDAFVAGLHVVRGRDQLKQAVSLVFERPSLYERLTGRQNLRLVADLVGVGPERVESVFSQLRVGPDVADRRVDTYSTGTVQRLAVARALLTEPAVLFLDEPTRGLDPPTTRELSLLIRQLAARGTTIVLATHELEDAEQLCHRVAFIHHGRLVALDTPASLKLRFGQRSAAVTLTDGSLVRLSLDDSEATRELSTWLSLGQVETVHTQEASLDDVFVALESNPTGVSATSDTPGNGSPVAPDRSASSEPPEPALSSATHRSLYRSFRALFTKDLRIAGFDGRILFALLVPLLFGGACGVFRSKTDITAPRPAAEAVYWAPDETALSSAIVAEGDLRGLDVRLRALPSADAVRQAVSDRDAALGLILPATPDGPSKPPASIVVLHTTRMADADIALVGLLEPAIEHLLHQPAQAQIEEETVPPSTTGLPGLYDQLGLNLLIIMLVLGVLSFVGSLTAPALMLEEIDKGTVQVLLTLVPAWVIVLAKAALATAVTTIGVGMVLVLSNLWPIQPLLLVVATLLCAVFVAGSGLLLGTIVRRTTWEAGLSIVPAMIIFGTASAALVFVRSWWHAALQLWPPGAAAMLIADAMAGVDLYGNPLLALATLVIWAPIPYIVLLTVIKRREW